MAEENQNTQDTHQENAPSSAHETSPSTTSTQTRQALSPNVSEQPVQPNQATQSQPTFTDPSQWNLQFPEDIPVDKETHNYFVELCGKNGISQQQAQAMIDFQTAAEQSYIENSIKNGIKELENRWGVNLSKNNELAMRTVTSLDKKTGGRLLQSLQSSGLTNNPLVVECFYEIGKLLSEDTLGAATMAGSFEREESAVDAFKSMFNQ